MTITRNDVKLRKPERLTDNDDGGGFMTSAEVVDGEVNNVFDDISRVNRTAGNVSLRKVFAHVDTASVDKFLGGHAILSARPLDPNVSLILFNTDSESDERANGKTRVESYLAPAAPYAIYPFGSQLQGSKFLSLFARPGTYKVPEVGEAIVISDEDFQAQEVNFQQFSRVVDVQITEGLTWVDTTSASNTTFKYDEVIVEISDSLLQDYAGFPEPRIAPAFSDVGTVIRSSVVQAAAQYFGIRPLALPASANDTAVRLDSILEQLVPSNTQESPIADEVPAGVQTHVVPAGPERTESIGENVSDGETVYTTRAIARGSLTLSGSGVTFTDNGDGTLTRSDNGSIGATVDYAAGAISFTSSTYLISATFTPAAAVTENSESVSIPIDEQNRGFNYTATLQPIPSPGTLSVSYRALGRWYTLTDAGDGSLQGDSAGTGTLNFATGTVLVTLAREPDSGTQIILTYGTPAHYTQRTAEVDNATPETVIELGQPIKQGTLSIEWDDGSGTATATDSNGSIGGAASGSVSYATGTIRIKPDALPAPGANYSITWERPSAISESVTASLNGDNLEFTLATTPAMPGSISFTTQEQAAAGIDYGGTGLFTIQWTDDGAGVMVGRVVATPGGERPPVMRAGELTGTINYATGAVSVKAQGTARLSQWVWRHSFGFTVNPKYWIEEDGDSTYSTISTVDYVEDGVAAAPQTASQPVGSITLDLTEFTIDGIVSGSVLFTFAGASYFDRAGTLYKDHDPETNAATPAGSVNYAAGLVTIDLWTQGASPTLSTKALLTRFGQWGVQEFSFRTEGSPLRVASLQVNAVAFDGTAFNATSDNNGDLTDPSGVVVGTVDYENGIADIAWVVDDNGGDPDKATWTFKEIDPNSLRYNAVVIAYLPISAEVIGLDTTRLPLDGRVPVFLGGYIVVVLHEQAEALPNPLQADTTYPLARGDLASVRVADQEGARVPDDQFTFDLEAGEITTIADLDLAGFVQPLVATHRIEDMRVCTGAQIGGTVSLNRPLSRDFPVGSYAASVAFLGTLQARVAKTFTQKVWQGLWADERVGDDSTAKYDDITYPFNVSNRGAVTERWAIKFTSSTTFEVIGEQRGVVATGNTSTLLTVTNPLTGEPYFQIEWEGWGQGWGLNNVLRFNTVSATHPLWLARCVLPGPTALADDSGRLEIRGDAD